MSLQEPGSLPLVCTDCSSLRDTLESIYSHPLSITTRSTEEDASYPNYTLEDRDCNIASICFTDGPPCCQLYKFMLQVRFQSDRQQNFKIVLVSSIFRNSTQHYTQELYDTTALAIVHEGEKLFFLSSMSDIQFVYPTSISIPTDQNRAILGRKVPEYLNYRILRDWVKSCQEDHQETCGIDTSELSDIPGFRLIVCSTGEIVPAPQQAEFVALSYVWGTVTSDPDMIAGTVPETAALVIRDAMIVAKNIGYRYLWVDRYCIPQDDEEARQAQIMRMDLIYKSAQLTIISAAGEDGSCGIPGVSTVPRTPQPQIDLSNVSLVSCLPSQRHEVNQSKWATRGWTYQEGLLSRRCLIFTWYQASFQCGTHYCPCESMDEPKFVKTRRWIDHEVDRRRNNPLPIKIDTKASNIYAHLTEYSMRELTYESDGLKAIQGVLNHFVASKVLECHIWGIPITRNLHSHESNGRLGRLTLAEKFAHALCWAGPATEDRRGEYVPIKRRAGFPSWSWVGWVGWHYWTYFSPIVDPAPERYNRPYPYLEPFYDGESSVTHLYYVRDITIVLKDGTMKRLNEMQIVGADVHLKPYIFIEARSFNLRFIDDPIEKHDEDPVTFVIKDDSKRWKLCPVVPMDMVHWNINPEKNPGFKNHIIKSAWTALVVGFTDSQSRLDLLIIENVGDHFERAGVLTSFGTYGRCDIDFRGVPMEKKTFKLG